MLKFEQTFIKEHQPTPGEIADLENRYKMSLPEDYKFFLLETNGGICIANILEIDKPLFSAIDLISLHGLGLVDSPQHLVNNSDLFTECKIYIEDDFRIPEKMIPISHEISGLILLATKDLPGLQNKGEIYYWDREIELETEPDEPQPRHNIVKIANSFTEFLNTMISIGEEKFEPAYNNFHGKGRYEEDIKNGYLEGY